MTQPDDPFKATVEFDGDDAGYSWWRDAHPAGYILAVRAKKAPLLHQASCSEVDRDRHPGRLAARGARQICAESKPALRGWVAATEPQSALVARCPKCAP